MGTITKITAIALICLLSVGCENVKWSPEQVAGMLNHCDRNGGIKTITTYPYNRELYSVTCADGASYQHLKTGIEEK